MNTRPKRDYHHEYFETHYSTAPTGNANKDDSNIIIMYAVTFLIVFFSLLQVFYPGRTLRDHLDFVKSVWFWMNDNIQQTWDDPGLFDDDEMAEEEEESYVADDDIHDIHYNHNPDLNHHRSANENENSNPRSNSNSILLRPIQNQVSSMYQWSQYFFYCAFDIVLEWSSYLFFGDSMYNDENNNTTNNSSSNAVGARRGGYGNGLISSSSSSSSIYGPTKHQLNQLNKKNDKSQQQQVPGQKQRSRLRGKINSLPMLEEVNPESSNHENDTIVDDKQDNNDKSSRTGEKVTSTNNKRNENASSTSPKAQAFEKTHQTITTTMPKVKNGTENIPQIDFSTNIEPAFLNDDEYPSGWLYYDPILGEVVERKQSNNAGRGLSEQQGDGVAVLWMNQ